MTKTSHKQDGIIPLLIYLTRLRFGNFKPSLVNLPHRSIRPDTKRSLMIHTQWHHIPRTSSYTQFTEGPCIVRSRHCKILWILQCLDRTDLRNTESHKIMAMKELYLLSILPGIQQFTNVNRVSRNHNNLRVLQQGIDRQLYESVMQLPYDIARSKIPDVPTFKTRCGLAICNYSHPQNMHVCISTSHRQARRQTELFDCNRCGDGRWYWRHGQCGCLRETTHNPHFNSQTSTGFSQIGNNLRFLQQGIVSTHQAVWRIAKSTYSFSVRF